jgi:hypothetical protein
MSFDFACRNALVETAPTAPSAKFVGEYPPGSASARTTADQHLLMQIRRTAILSTLDRDNPLRRRYLRKCWQGFAA